MTTGVAPARSNRGLTAVLAVAAVLIAAAAAAYYYDMQRRPAPAAATATAPISAFYGIAIDADGAVNGNDAAVDSFQYQLRQLKDAAVTQPGSAFARDARFPRPSSRSTSTRHQATTRPPCTFPEVPPDDPQNAHRTAPADRA